jgi:outer membrane protein OmpA-like peptidoglycan-associated protein
MRRAIVTVLFAALLTVPLLAQDNGASSSSSSQTQNAASSAQDSSAQTSSSSQTSSSAQTSSNQTSAATDQAAQSATGKPLQPPPREGFWGHLNPFARKKYVQRQTEPIRDRLNELDELTASNSKAIKDVDARAQAGIQQASNKANDADQHAIDAGNKAQQAQQTATQANTRLNSVEQVVGNIDQYKATNQTEIRFKAGQTALSANAKSALDEMAEPLKNQRGYIIEVQGFSSSHGQAGIQTSTKLADSVVRYLVVNHNIPVYRIYVVGMGNAAAQQVADQSNAKPSTGNRVEVSLLKNDLEQLSSNAAPAAAQPQ